MVSHFYGLTHQEVALRRDMLGLEGRKGRHPALDEAQDIALWNQWRALAAWIIGGGTGSVFAAQALNSPRIARWIMPNKYPAGLRIAACSMAVSSFISVWRSSVTHTTQADRQRSLSLTARQLREAGFR